MWVKSAIGESTFALTARERGSQTGANSSSLALAKLSGSEGLRSLNTYSGNVRCGVSVLLQVACRWRHRTPLVASHGMANASRTSSGTMVQHAKSMH